MNNDVLTKVIEPIISLMEAGTLPPWSKCWNASVGNPVNALSGKEYSGSNKIILQFSSMKNQDPRFLGFAQAKKIGGSIKKGAKSIPILMPIIKKIESDSDPDPENRDKLVGYRVGRVFSVADCVGLDPNKIVSLPKKKKKLNPIQAAEDFISLRNPTITSGDQPCYIPKLDEIRIPSINQFKSPELYYSTLLHEIGHWTGAEDRMNRKGIVQFDRFGSKQYGEEELVAELFSALCRSELGIETAVELKDSVSYLSGWIKTLKETPQILFSAVKESDKAFQWFGDRSAGSTLEGREAA